MNTTPSGPANNTAIDYMYRDDANFKAYASVVLTGRLTKAQAVAMSAHDQFLPEQVDLDSIAGTDGTDLDGPWHEMRDIRPTTERPTLGGVNYPNAAEWARKFDQIVWDPKAAMDNIS